MAFDILYPDEGNEQIHRHSSIDQFKDNFLCAWKQGGWAPIVFDQLDGIICETIKTHPVTISFGGDLGYVFPEAHCTYSSDHFIYVDKNGVEKRLLPECFGGKGEFYDKFVKSNSFIVFDNDTSLGLHNRFRLRTGLDYVTADETLPAVD